MVHRVDVRSNTDRIDRAGEGIRHQIAQFGMRVGPVTPVRIFLIDTDEGPAAVRRIAQELLADPVVEQFELVTSAPADEGVSRIEVHLKPGVMDPVAASTEMAIRDMGLSVRQVRTGRAYLIQGQVERDELARIAYRALANGVIESVHFRAVLPAPFPQGQPYALHVEHVKLLGLSDEALMRLSREGHLFLSLAEMQAIQAYFRRQDREPTDVELETIAQTWSEHCVHKTLKSAVEVEELDERAKVVGRRRYGNLIKETIFASTKELMEKREDGGSRIEGGAARALPSSILHPPPSDFCLSVFKDNAGVIAFDDTDAVCFKVETHNHPSAIEPYGGSATGIGGVIRDVLGTGLAAKPIANTDVFCVAFPDAADPIANPKSQIANVPEGVLHPKRILQQVVAGVRDYGNRMGIPTVNGAVYFDDRYLGNPLVFCGCVGLIPRDKIQKEARAGDAIIVMGGRTGRDGIHGATFSSAELTTTHADEFSHAVQIGNAITEKTVTDVVLAARDRGLFNAITDCGAGGLSSAVGEMGESLGAAVDLEKVPLKYAGLHYDEIWISEAQERMVLAVPPDKVDQLLALARSEDVEANVIGTFGTSGAELVLRYGGSEVGRLSMEFLHNGIPMPTRRAVVRSTGFQPVARSTGFQPVAGEHRQDACATVRERLLRALAHPNIASKHWIIRQYDHEVQGGSVIKPLTGPLQVGPSDAAVLRPKLDSYRGVALGCGLAPHIKDPYQMAIAAIDEAIRNVVAVGADPSRTAILDNFCWPSVDDERTMGDLVRACEACRDAARAYGIPFISGKDSLNNQFIIKGTGQVIRIPNTLLISAIGIVEDVRKCVTMDLKDGREGRLALISPPSPPTPLSPSPGTPGEGRGEGAGRLAQLAAVHRALAAAIARGMVLSCHDVSDGGWLTAAAEMCIGSGLGLALEGGDPADMFDESPGRYLVEVHALGLESFQALLASAGASMRVLGSVNAAPILQVGRLMPDRSTRYDLHVSVDDLTRAWRGTLDW